MKKIPDGQAEEVDHKGHEEQEDGIRKGALDDAIGEVKEKQARTPWHREGSDQPPVKRDRTASAMTKGESGFSKEQYTVGWWEQYAGLAVSGRHRVHVSGVTSVGRVKDWLPTYSRPGKSELRVSILGPMILIFLPSQANSLLPPPDFSNSSSPSRPSTKTAIGKTSNHSPSSSTLNNLSPTLNASSNPNSP